MTENAAATPEPATDNAAATATPETATATTVLFVRHGRTATTGSVLPGRAPGLHLSDDGRADAAGAAARLAEVSGVAAVVTSPLERTMETAAPIAAALGLEVTAEPGLLECDFGEWTGRSLAELRALPQWSTVQHTPSRHRFPCGESFVEMSARIVATVDRLVAEHPGQRIVCVSHADPIKALLAHAAGTHLDHLQRLVVSPCSISVVHYGPAAPAVLTINSAGTGLGSLTLS
ncbi:MAG TPA: MSMEG_4193 family putative phosphomutase [Microthrixaceae bacterium]|nr:MSMEG_4193 family putative phosphomutase [Microthrixaceae bacterium]